MSPISTVRIGKSVKSVKTLRSEEMFEVAGPRFIGAEHYNIKVPKRVSLTAPPIQIFEFANVRTMGGSNLVFIDDTAVHPDVVDPNRDMLLAEVVGQANFVPRSQKLHILPEGVPKKVEGAISLLGECTGNYAHWMIETLPKLVIIDQMSEYDDLPLLVDGWIHPIFFHSLTLLNTKCREVKRVDRWQMVEAEKLIYITPPSYTAPENRAYHKNGKRPDPSPDSYLMSPKEFDLLRNKAVAEAGRYVVHGRTPRELASIFRIDRNNGGSELGPKFQVALHDPPMKHDPFVRYSEGKFIYLKRTARSAGNPRQLLAQHRVEALLADYGFLAIDPAILPFEEQVLLLSNAVCVVAPIGAAMANAVFAPRGVKFVALAPYYRGADYYYFSNMMGALGHDLHYVLGPQWDNPSVHWLHQDYQVDLTALRVALDRFCGN